ncbi:hypothetical protein LRS56_06260 [Pseudomonas poae]|nr:hypothetical protein LRS56_06260 [Pseudomonas poae]
MNQELDLQQVAKACDIDLTAESAERFSVEVLEHSAVHLTPGHFSGTKKATHLSGFFLNLGAGNETCIMHPTS